MFPHLQGGRAAPTHVCSRRQAGRIRRCSVDAKGSRASRPARTVARSRAGRLTRREKSHAEARVCACACTKDSDQPSFIFEFSLIIIRKPAQCSSPAREKPTSPAHHALNFAMRKPKPTSCQLRASFAPTPYQLHTRPAPPSRQTRTSFALNPHHLCAGTMSPSCRPRTTLASDPHHLHTQTQRRSHITRAKTQGDQHRKTRALHMPRAPSKAFDGIAIHARIPLELCHMHARWARYPRKGHTPLSAQGRGKEKQCSKHSSESSRRR